MVLLGEYYQAQHPLKYTQEGFPIASLERLWFQHNYSIELPQHGHIRLLLASDTRGFVFDVFIAQVPPEQAPGPASSEATQKWLNRNAERMAAAYSRHFGFEKGITERHGQYLNDPIYFYGTDYYVAVPHLLLILLCLFPALWSLIHHRKHRDQRKSNTPSFMRIRFPSISAVLVLVAALLVLLETLYFASLRPGYSHISNTISELGETGASCAHQVAFGFFLPVGLLVWLALWLVRRGASDRYASVALVAMSCLGAGYAMAAFFPCDSGAPFFGSWRTQIHNIIGFIDYEGTGIGFLLVSRYFARQKATGQAAAFLVAGVLVLICLALLSLQATFHVRGMIQRIAEVIQFAGVFFVCYLLSKEMTLKAAHEPAPKRPLNF